MFNNENILSDDFSERENIVDRFVALRSLATELEFKREEMNHSLDSLQKALTEFSNMFQPAK